MLEFLGKINEKPNAVLATFLIALNPKLQFTEDLNDIMEDIKRLKLRQ